MEFKSFFKAPETQVQWGDITESDIVSGSELFEWKVTRCCRQNRWNCAWIALILSMFLTAFSVVLSWLVGSTEIEVWISAWVMFVTCLLYITLGFDVQNDYKMSAKGILIFSTVTSPTWLVCVCMSIVLVSLPFSSLAIISMLLLTLVELIRELVSKIGGGASTRVLIRNEQCLAIYLCKDSNKLEVRYVPDTFRDDGSALRLILRHQEIKRCVIDCGSNKRFSQIVEAMASHYRGNGLGKIQFPSLRMNQMWSFPTNRHYLTSTTPSTASDLAKSRLQKKWRLL